jgi:CO/xanthine dehydrogenase Mo-binding subunit
MTEALRDLEAASPSTAIEPERYELLEPGRYRFDLDRRGFLRVLTAMGGGLLVVSTVPVAAQQETGRGGGQGAATDALAGWLHIGPDGRVTVYTGKVEIGQNIRTSLAQTVADELSAPMAAISLVMADTDLTPFDQGTFGSRTTPTMAPQLARAAATAREMLIDLAAAKWQVPRQSLAAKDGAVADASGRSISFGELTHGQNLTGVVSSQASEEPRDRWAVRGEPLHKVNARAIVTGTHAYPADVIRPGLLIGRMIRPPALGATVKAVDDSKARAMAGVMVVRDGEFIGVVAPNERAAKAAAAAVAVEWNLPTGLPTSETIFDYLRQTAQPAQGRGGGGDRADGAASSRPGASAGAATPTSPAVTTRTFDATYRIPYIAHVPLEPRAAVAEWTGDKVTVWTGSQRPFGVRSDVARAFHLAEDRVRVIVPDVGSAYGGKHTVDVATEAARLAKAAGHPVKIVYTRAEEFMWGYFRPAGVITISAGVDAGGRLASWQFENYNSGSSGLNTPYAVATKRELFHNAESPLKQGSYRGLAATANHYAREMHMDAIARAIGQDAVDFRLAHITDSRLRAVLTTVAQKAGWPNASRPGLGLGIACGTEKGSYIATAAEVSRTPDGFKVERLVAAFECGAIVNPDGLRNQVEGAIAQGLGGALFESIRFADGKILNGTMAEYRVPRFRDMPPIDITLIDRRDLPSAGAGETPIVCVAPAIGTAVRAFGTVDTALPITLKA